MVDFDSRLKSPRVKRLSKLDFPTPESPMRTILKRKSYASFWAMACMYVLLVVGWLVVGLVGGGEGRLEEREGKGTVKKKKKEKR